MLGKKLLSVLVGVVLLLSMAAPAFAEAEAPVITENEIPAFTEAETSAFTEAEEDLCAHWLYTQYKYEIITSWIDHGHDDHTIYYYIKIVCSMCGEVTGNNETGSRREAHLKKTVSLGHPTPKEHRYRTTCRVDSHFFSDVVVSCPIEGVTCITYD